MQTSRGPDEVHQVVKVKLLVTQTCPTFFNSKPARLLCPWNPSGTNTGVGCHFLLQGIEPRSLGVQAGSLPWEPPGKPHQVVVIRVQQSWGCEEKRPRRCKCAYKCRRPLFRRCAKSCLFAIQKAPKLKKTHVSHCSLQCYLQ